MKLQKKISKTQNCQDQQLDLLDFTQLNPDWQFATQHGNSFRPGITYHKRDKLGRTSITEEQIQLCRCCLNQIKKQPVPYCQYTKQLDVIGFGFPIYFSFLRNCILLLFILLISYGAITFFQSIQRNTPICQAYIDAHSTSASHVLNIDNKRFLAETSSDGTFNCFSFFISVAHIQTQLSDYQIVIRFITFCATLVMLLMIKKHLYQLNQYFDQKTTSLSDYSIIIGGLPKQKRIQQKVKVFFKSAFQFPHQIQQITMVPIINDFKKIQKEKRKLIKEKIQFLKQEQQEKIAQVDNQISKKQTELQNYCLQAKKNAQKDQIITQKMILVFNSQGEKIQILQQFDKLSDQLKKQHFGEKFYKVTLSQAPQPKQIIWECINYPTTKRIMRIIFVWIISIAFLTAITVGFYYLIRAKSLLLESSLKNFSKDPQAYAAQRGWAIALVYIALVLVILFNKLILGYIFHVLTEFQNHETTSSEQLSFAFKYALGLFFTTAVMTLAVEAFTLNNYYLHQYGVIQQQSIMFFLNAFFVPIIWIVNPWHLFKILKQKYHYGSQKLTQQQANVLMEPVHYDMGKRIAQIVQTMWFTFLYVTIIPLGAITSLIGLTIYYWVDKYNLLRRSGVPRHINGQLPQNSIFFLSFVLLLFSLGCLIFDIHLKDIVHWSTIVMLSISVVFIFIPWSKVLSIFMKEKFEIQKKTYNQVKADFLWSYHSLHPIIRALRLSKLIKNFERARQGASIANRSQNGQKENQQINYPSKDVIKFRNNRNQKKKTQPQSKLRKPSIQIKTSVLHPSQAFLIKDDFQI